MGASEWFANLYSRTADAAKTSTFRLLATITVTSALTAVSLLGVQTLQRRTQRRALRDNVESHFRTPSRKGSTASATGKSAGDDFDEELENYLEVRHNLKRSTSELEVQTKTVGEDIIREQLARNIAFLGEEAVERIRKSFVVVVGLGGVGSAAATILLRSGVGKLRLIDFDQVTLSSLNRHTVATLADVGIPKVTACKRQFAAIAPWVQVDARVELFSLEDADALLEGKPDWVIDCIDNIHTKCELLKYCHDRHINVFSAMGAGGKVDPSRIQISDISVTYEDSLARAVRQNLRRVGIASGIPVVYSTEVPKTQGKLLPLPEEEFQKGLVHELSALDKFRVRILPVLGPLPCMFGQAAAAYIIAKLAGSVEMEPLPVKNRTKLYHKMYQDLLAREVRRTGESKLPVSEEDIAYVFEELHKGRSVVAPDYKICARPALMRWEKDKPVTWNNLVVMERDEATKHERECLIGDSSPLQVWSGETCALVAQRQELEQQTRDRRLL